LRSEETVAQEPNETQDRLGTVARRAAASVAVAESLTGGELSARFASAPDARLMGADIAIAVTGVAGPGEQDGQSPGTVWFALHHDGATETRLEHFSGTPPEIVDATCARAIQWVLDHCETHFRAH
jgi:nicotinamide mononucleotide (NMN) deamidase PncC